MVLSLLRATPLCLFGQCSFPCSHRGDGIRQTPQFKRRERSISPRQMRAVACLFQQQQQTFRSAQLPYLTLRQYRWKLLLFHLSTSCKWSPGTTGMKGLAPTELREVRASSCKVRLPVSTPAAPWDGLGAAHTALLLAAASLPAGWISSWIPHCSLWVCIWSLVMDIHMWVCIWGST